MRNFRRLLALFALAALLAASGPARAATPAEICRHLGTDDRLREIPFSLMPAAVRLFGFGAVPAAQVQRGTFFRCFESHVLVCNVGANLPCGKADTSRDLPAATASCAKNPGSNFIPMYVTGHTTIYQWRCAETEAIAGGRIFHVDPRGFIARFWSPRTPDLWQAPRLTPHRASCPRAQG
ncbi:MAG: hypothetical protein M0002_20700 [Rhodospirillales bacterium]|nr:hypothetical protein [Rhodospirillales bacterium]